MNDYDDCILFLLAKAYQQVNSGFKAKLKPLGLTPVQNLVLAALREQDGVPVGEIGRRLVFDTATLTGILDRMDSAGWIEKRTDPEDGRVVRVWLSERAREMSSDLGETIREMNEEALEGFRLEEKMLLKRILRDMKG